ncbi:hypothetical protein C5167_008173 [Papaver somniferum]|uniref:gibberellin 2beta-dioxygenase n=1 Tax=Papaver somniferum TaxID=3469 RepID=A0A4Y7JXP1_PAPSO|nr:gibberellin 2-beta-dioxygenase-like [Papaver somniferum]RZC64499.1 hypothetical protein C5167_008173 [Papaver somniferum]
MVIYSKPSLLEQNFSTPIRTFIKHQQKTIIPVIDMSNPYAKHNIVKACEEYGFFKVINHGIPMELMSALESEAVKFFSLPQFEKDKAVPASPFGYGNKKVGPNGDVGWIEYLLLSTKLDSASSSQLFNSLRGNPDFFRSLVKSYIGSVKNLATEVLRLLADGLMMQERNVFSRLLEDEESDSIFRLNHYPPCPPPPNHRNTVGFGEHTDPQVISVLRSNNITGLQIADKNGSWIPVPPDQNSFFINVGDSLQVMSNGRFKSVKHRVIQNSMKSRVSMIYFGGPPSSERIAPLPSLLAEGEQSLYKEFTWSEYKTSAYKSRLADNRLCKFEKQQLSRKIPLEYRGKVIG